MQRSTLVISMWILQLYAESSAPENWTALPQQNLIGSGSDLLFAQSLIRGPPQHRFSLSAPLHKSLRTGNPFNGGWEVLIECSHGVQDTVLTLVASWPGPANRSSCPPSQRLHVQAVRWREVSEIKINSTGVDNIILPLASQMRFVRLPPHPQSSVVEKFRSSDQCIKGLLVWMRP